MWASEAAPWASMVVSLEDILLLIRELLVGSLRTCWSACACVWGLGGPLTSKWGKVECYSA